MSTHNICGEIRKIFNWYRPLTWTYSIILLDYIDPWKFRTAIIASQYPWWLSYGGLILKLFKPHLLPNLQSDWAKTWWEALRGHGDSNLLKCFHSNIQDGCHGSHLENLQTTSAPKPKVRLNQNLMGGIEATWQLPGIGAKWIFRIVKILLFWYPRWPAWWPSWNSSNCISSQTVSQLELKLEGRHQTTWRFRTAKIGVTRITEIPKYYRNTWNTHEKFRFNCERHLLKMPILALIN